MKEYIERASLMGALTSGTEQLAMREMTGAEAYAEFVRLVNFAPAANVVEVVRCKNCRFFSGRQECYCHEADENGTPIFVREDDFCSYGARMDKEVEHEAD